MARFLVTGGAGFIGSHVAEALLLRGDEVVILDDLNTFYDPAIKRENLDEISRVGRFTFHEGDIRDASLVSRAFEAGLDGVVHLAALAGVRPSLADPARYVSVNLSGSTTLFDAAVKHRVRRFVFASSSSVYGNNTKVPFHEDDAVDHPISPYAATKKAGELLAHSYHAAHGLPVFCLRFFTVYGPRQRPEMAIHSFARKMEAGHPIPFFGDGSSRRDYTYITDIVDGVLRALDRVHGYRVFNLGESATTTLSELVAHLEVALGKKANLDRQAHQQGDVQETFADISRAREELGYAPQTAVANGIPRFVAWLRSRR